MQRNASQGCTMGVVCASEIVIRVFAACLVYRYLRELLLVCYFCKFRGQPWLVIQKLSFSVPYTL